jgi:hypothetical protein
MEDEGRGREHAGLVSKKKETSVIFTMHDSL